MSSIKCSRCGGLTNTALSDHEFKMTDNTASRCYARYENDVWGRGCAYNEVNPYDKFFVDKILENNPNEPTEYIFNEDVDSDE